MLHRIVLVSALLFTATAAAVAPVASAALEPAEGWKLVKKSENLVLYERDVPGSDVIAFRGEGMLDAPIARVASVLLDNERAKEWVDSLEESKVLRRINPMEYIEYDHIGTPFVMKDRDFVAHVWIEVDKPNRSLVLRYRSEDDPSAPKSGYVRGELINSRFVLTSFESGKKTLLLAEIHADPKGSVPKWIVNLFQRSWPSETFSGIKKQLAKPNIGVPAEFANIISQLRF